MDRGHGAFATVNRSYALAATGSHLLLLEQGFRFFDFGEILRRVEIDKDWREHLGYRPPLGHLAQ